MNNRFILVSYICFFTGACTFQTKFSYRSKINQFVKNKYSTDSIFFVDFIYKDKNRILGYVYSSNSFNRNEIVSKNKDYITTIKSGILEVLKKNGFKISLAKDSASNIITVEIKELISVMYPRLVDFKTIATISTDIQIVASKSGEINYHNLIKGHGQKIRISPFSFRKDISLSLYRAIDDFILIWLSDPKMNVFEK